MYGKVCTYVLMLEYAYLCWLVEFNTMLSENVLVGTDVPGDVGRGSLYLTLHCHHLNDSCIKLDSDESHFNISLTVRYKGTVFKKTQLFKSREPKWNQTEVLLLTSLMPSH